MHALQTSLRPILVNLAYYNKLKLPLLRGLARLLKLLASWFNVTLGEALPQGPCSGCGERPEGHALAVYLSPLRGQLFERRAQPSGCAAAGEKLIDHLKKWLEPEKLLAVQHSWDPGQECQIAAAILDLFHLLPPPAVKFLETQARHPLTTHSPASCTRNYFWYPMWRPAHLNHFQ